MKILKRNIIDMVILSLSLLYILFMIWAHLFTNIMPQVLIGLMIISLVLMNKKNIIKNADLADLVDLIFLSVCLLLLLINIKTTSGVYERKNLERILHSAVILIYYSQLINKKNEFVRNYFKGILPWINIYYVLNLIIMYIQTKGTYFLMDTVSTGNTYYLDMITGLIGADGVHCVAIFTVFVILLNLVFLDIKVGQRRKLSVIYLMITTAFSLFIATQNDNNALLILIPLMAVVCLINKTELNIYNIITKIWKPVVIVIVAFVGVGVLANSSSGLFSDIAYRLNLTITSYSITGGTLAATDERFRLFSLALEKGGAWGNGWGSIEMFSDSSINLHFGMAAIQPMIYMGGWVFYVLFNITIAKIFVGNKPGYLKKWGLLVCILILMSYFTQIFIIDRLTYFMSFLCIAFLMLPNGKDGIASTE